MASPRRPQDRRSIGALATASAAQARSDVILSIGINAPYGYVQPAPVYVQPAPVYYQPQPVYYNPPHRPYQRGGAWGDADRDGVANRYDRAPYNPYRR